MRSLPHQLTITCSSSHERVRVLETRIEPGDATPVHTHRWPNVQYVLSGTDFDGRAGYRDDYAPRL